MNDAPTANQIVHMMQYNNPIGRAIDTGDTRYLKQHENTAGYRQVFGNTPIVEAWEQYCEYMGDYNRIEVGQIEQLEKEGVLYNMSFNRSRDNTPEHNALVDWLEERRIRITEDFGPGTRFILIDGDPQHRGVYDETQLSCRTLYRAYCEALDYVLEREVEDKTEILYDRIQNLEYRLRELQTRLNVDTESNIEE